MTNEPRRQCYRCDGWSRELVEVKSEYPGLTYWVHAHEVAEMKALVREARAVLKTEKAENLKKYGQRYAH